MTLTAFAVVRHAQYCEADVPVLIENARLWLVSVAPFKEDADPEVLARLRRREHS